MAFQFCTNDFYLYAETEPADPGQTQVTNEPESEPSDSTGEAAEETPSSDIGTPEPSAPVEEQPAAPVEEQPVTPVEEQPEVASTLKVEFVDANNASVKETVEQALTSKYVGKTINLDELGIDINVEGYTLTEIKDKNDNTQVYTTETKDFVLTGNVTELQFVYTQNVQTDQPEESEDSNAQQGGQEDSNSTQEQEEADDEDSDSQNTKEKESPLKTMFITQGDVSLYSVQDKENTYYEVKFVDQNDFLIVDQYILEGANAVAPTCDWANSELSPGAQFVGWKSSVDEKIYTNAQITNIVVNTDTTYTAVFEQTKKYTITINYVYTDGTVIRFSKVDSTNN